MLPNEGVFSRKGRVLLLFATGGAGGGLSRGARTPSVQDADNLNKTKLEVRSISGISKGFEGRIPCSLGFQHRGGNVVVRL